MDFTSRLKIYGQLILIIFFATDALGQSTKFPTKADLTKTYSKAIGDFVKAAKKRNKIGFDTLFIGKRTNGQSDDFPDIILPETIEKVYIKLITPDAGLKSQHERKSRIYLNIIGWVNKDYAEFIFVVFSNGFEHQYDYKLNYKYNSQKKEFDLEKIQFKGPPFDEWK